MIHTLIFLAAFTFTGVPQSKIEREVLAAMETWRQAMVAHDRAVLEKLYAPDLSYTHSNGRHENKAEAIEAVVNGKDRIESLTLGNPSVRIHGATVLVEATAILQMNSGGSVTTLNLDVLYVWIKNSSGWQLIARHALRK